MRTGGGDDAGDMKAMCRVASRWLLGASVALFCILVSGSFVGADTVVLNDDRRIEGSLLSLGGETLRVAGHDETLAVYEVATIQFVSDEEVAKLADFDPGKVRRPLLWFRSGEVVRADVIASDGVTANVSIDDVGQLQVPAHLIFGFRFQSIPSPDSLFRSDVAAWRARQISGRGHDLERQLAHDRVYVQRRNQLLRVDGTVRQLTADELRMEYQGRTRTIRRERIYAAILAPIAVKRTEVGIPALLELRRGGMLPVYVAKLGREREASKLHVRFHGSDASDLQAVPLSAVARIRFYSDRVRFLSDLEPVSVDEKPLIGSKSAFGWRKDQATTGGPIRIHGKHFRRGLGVHARSSLEFAMDGDYESFAATLGLVDGAGADSGVTYRIVADGKTIYEKALQKTDAAEKFVVPIGGVRRLRLVVDYGEDGVDFGDHAAWADARLLR